eukprot:2206678-Pleurochrysis_carterae.AAC.1
MPLLVVKCLVAIFPISALYVFLFIEESEKDWSAGDGGEAENKSKRVRGIETRNRRNEGRNEGNRMDVVGAWNSGALPFSSHQSTHFIMHVFMHLLNFIMHEGSERKRGRGRGERQGRE